MFSPSCFCCPVTSAPVGYGEYDLSVAEPHWDDSKHIDLTQPEFIKTLEGDLRNDPAFVRELPSNYGCCSSFKVMSDEGMSVLDIALAGIEKYSVKSPRIPKVLRGGVFRSKFLNGMGHSAAVLRHVSSLAGCELVYHPMKLHQIHVNWKPDSDHEINVDKWHCDTTPFVLILFCTDPSEYSGGTLQYFKGTREEGTALLSAGNGVPAARIINVGLQSKGHGVFMQGWRVFHQVTSVTSGPARTTAVFSFHPRNVLALEACNHLGLTYNQVDPLHILLPDWARFRAWKSLRRIEMFEDELKVSDIVPPSSQLMDLVAILVVCKLKFARIVHSLPYTDDRTLLTEELEQTTLELTAFSQLFPEELLPISAATCSATANREKDFLGSKFGLSNVFAIVVDIADCILDIKTLQAGESPMVYF